MKKILFIILVIFLSFLCSCSKSVPQQSFSNTSKGRESTSFPTNSYPGILSSLFPQE